MPAPEPAPVESLAKGILADPVRKRFLLGRAVLDMPRPHLNLHMDEDLPSSVERWTLPREPGQHDANLSRSGIKVCRAVRCVAMGMEIPESAREDRTR